MTSGLAKAGLKRLAITDLTQVERPGKKRLASLEFGKTWQLTGRLGAHEQPGTGKRKDHRRGFVAQRLIAIAARRTALTIFT